MKFHLVNPSSLWELEKSHRLKLRLKSNLSFLHPINLKTILSLKTILLMMTMISMSKVLVQFIVVLQMNYRLRR